MGVEAVGEGVSEAGNNEDEAGNEEFEADEADEDKESSNGGAMIDAAGWDLEAGISKARISAAVARMGTTAELAAAEPAGQTVFQVGEQHQDSTA
jgi:hypothetical protein